MPTTDTTDAAEDFVRRVMYAVVTDPMPLPRIDDKFVNELRAMIERERESCAEIAENHRAVDKYREQYGWPLVQQEIAAAIRARK